MCNIILVIDLQGPCKKTLEMNLPICEPDTPGSYDHENLQCYQNCRVIIDAQLVGQKGNQPVDQISDIIVYFNGIQAWNISSLST